MLLLLKVCFIFWNIGLFSNVYLSLRNGVSKKANYSPRIVLHVLFKLNPIIQNRIFLSEAKDL